MRKLLNLTPETMKALCAPLPNFHKMWQQYLTSNFRREYLRAWAGNDPEKQRAARELLNETGPQ